MSALGSILRAAGRVLEHTAAEAGRQAVERAAPHIEEAITGRRNQKDQVVAALRECLQKLEDL